VTPSRHFGAVRGVEVGHHFPDRKAASKAGVHRPTQPGISGSATEGCDSICVSGGYVDDLDRGDVLVYTGQGGRDPNTGKQVADQSWGDAKNAALVVSELEGLPIRVLRGSKGDPAHSPATGYRYDGLYRVSRHWAERGRHGYMVCRYELRRISADPVPVDALSGSGEQPGAEVGTPAPRVTTTIQRIARSTAVGNYVKRLHRHTCQVCGEVIGTPGGPYAEGAHIRPLGFPHNGPDVVENVLCLCPNDHVRFDTGAIWLDDDLVVVDAATGQRTTSLRKVKGHSLRPDCVEYHRGMWQES